MSQNVQTRPGDSSLGVPNDKPMMLDRSRIPPLPVSLNCGSSERDGRGRSDTGISQQLPSKAVLSPSFA